MKIVEGWEIPKMRLYPELFDDIKKLYGKFGQSEVDQETVAQLWGHKSAKSSQFNFVKLGSLRTYRLIEGRGKIKISDLGRRLTYPKNEKESNDAILEAIKNIPLWTILFDTFTVKGVDLPTDTFWMNLRQIVGEDKLPPEEAKKTAKIVRKAYFEDVKYYKRDLDVKKERDKMNGGKIDISISTIDIQAGHFSQTIPWTEEGVKLAKGFIDLLGKQIPSKEKSKE